MGSLYLLLKTHREGKETIGLNNTALSNDRDKETTEGKETFVDHGENETAERYRSELAARLKDKKVFDTVKESEKEYWKLFNRANPEHAKPQLAEEPVPLEPVKPKNNTRKMQRRRHYE